MGFWDLQKISITVGIVLAGLTILGKVTGFFGWLLKQYRQWHQSSFALIEVPKKTVILVPVSLRNAFWWHMGSMSGQPAMQIVGDLNVTNISKYNVYLMGARLRKPRAVGHVCVRVQGSNIYSSNSMIPQGALSDLRFDFFVQPPVCKEGSPFKADVAIIDQFGNEHWLKKVNFLYM